MARYSDDFKARAVARLLPPECAPIPRISQEIGVSVATLERWMSDARWRRCRSLRRRGRVRRRHGRIGGESRNSSGFATQGQGARRNCGSVGFIKKIRGALPRGRGRMISLEERRKIVAMIEQARREGARLKAACGVGGTLRFRGARGMVVVEDHCRRSVRDHRLHNLPRVDRRFSKRPAEKVFGRDESVSRAR